MEEFTTIPTLPEPETEPQSAPSGRAAWLQLTYDILETILLSAALFLVINALTARVRVDGYSMLPTLNDGNFVLVNRLAYRFGEPERGDIIVFHYDPNQQDLIKRIIGLPGDEVRAANGVIYVNGVALVEPYIAELPAYSGNWQVPAGYFFVLGDNRNNSSDSHAWGVLLQEKVIGKAVFVYWPFSQVTVLDHFELLKANQ